MDNHEQSAAPRVERHRHEGPRNHIISFAISIFLTILAFIAIIYQDLVDSTFLWMFLLTLAIIQAVVQLAFWMHMKDRGHLMPVIFFATGTFIALTAVITGLYWVWW